MNGFDITWVWAFGILGLAVGFGAGAFVGFRFLTNRQRTAELEQELEAVRAEKEQYKQQVTAHFARTAELFQGMAENYRSVYRHLAEGASTLCGELPQTARLDLPDTLGLGEPMQQTVAAAPGGDAVGEGEKEESPEYRSSQPETAPGTQEQGVVPAAATAASEFEPGTEEEEKDKTVLH